MFNSPLKPVVIPTRKQRKRIEQHPSLKKLFNNDDNEDNYDPLYTTQQPLRTNSLQKYNTNTRQNNSLVNSLMFNKFILNGSRSKQISSHTLHKIYPRICLNHLLESRIVNQLSRISQLRMMNNSMVLGDEMSPITPRSSSSGRKKKKKENFIQSRTFQYKASSGMTTMQFIPKSTNGGGGGGNQLFSNEILLGGDVDGQIQIFKIEDNFMSNHSSAHPTIISLPSRSFINRICVTSSGECFIASDDSTLYSCDVTQVMTDSQSRLTTFNEHVNYITDVKANWRESLIASSSLDKTLKIWYRQFSRPVYSINVNEFVHSCCWMPRSDFSFFTSSSKDSIITANSQPCSIKWWDLRKLSSYVSEIIQTNNFVDFQSNIAYASLGQLDDGYDEWDGQYSSLFGNWSSGSQKHSTFPKQHAEFSFGSEQQESSNIGDYFDNKLQKYVEPFISHCRSFEKIFDLNCIENSRGEPILISTSQLGSKLWSLNCSRSPCGISSLTHKYSSSTTLSHCMNTQIVPVFLNDDTMFTGCVDGNLYMWNSIHSIENSNKKTNYSHKFEKIHPSSIRSLAISDTLLASSDQFGNLSVVSMCDDTEDYDSNMEIRAGNSSFEDISLNSSFDSSSTSLIMFDSIFDIIERTKNSQLELESLCSISSSTTAESIPETPTKKKRKSSTTKSSSSSSSSNKKKK